MCLLVPFHSAAYGLKPKIKLKIVFNCHDLFVFELFRITFDDC